jgi:hypothetical protein
MANDKMILQELRNKLSFADVQLSWAVEYGSDTDIQDAQCALESAAADLAKAEEDLG